MCRIHFSFSVQGDIPTKTRQQWKRKLHSIARQGTNYDVAPPSRINRKLLLQLCRLVTLPTTISSWRAVVFLESRFLISIFCALIAEINARERSLTFAANEAEGGGGGNRGRARSDRGEAALTCVNMNRIFHALDVACLAVFIHFYYFSASCVPLGRSYLELCSLRLIFFPHNSSLVLRARFFGFRFSLRRHEAGGGRGKSFLDLNCVKNGEKVKRKVLDCSERTFDSLWLGLGPRRVDSWLNPLQKVFNSWKSAQPEPQGCQQVSLALLLIIPRVVKISIINDWAQVKPRVRAGELTHLVSSRESFIDFATRFHVNLSQFIGLASQHWCVFTPRTSQEYYKGKKKSLISRWSLQMSRGTINCKHNQHTIRISFSRFYISLFRSCKVDEDGAILHKRVCYILPVSFEFINKVQRWPIMSRLCMYQNKLDSDCDY